MHLGDWKLLTIWGAASASHPPASLTVPATPRPSSKPCSPFYLWVEGGQNLPSARAWAWGSPGGLALVVTSPG